MSKPLYVWRILTLRGYIMSTKHKAEFYLKDFMSPGCACNLEGAIKKNVPTIEKVSINSLDNTLLIEYDKTETKEAVRDWLEKCGYNCVETKSTETDHAKMDHAKMDHAKMDHAKMDHAKMDHAKMDHAKMDHAKMDHGDHGNHHEMMVAEFRTKTIVVTLITIPVLLLSPTIQGWLGITGISFPFQDFVLAFLASVIVFYGASTFFKGARRALKSGILDMSVLVSLAVLSGYLYSLAATFVFKDVADFYWEISTLVLFLVFGHWMEMRAVAGASGALNALVKLIPPMANLVDGDDIKEVETSELKVGDVILIRPGEKVPIDGKVIEGQTNVNEAMITGEAKPVSKKEGDMVIGGTLNQTGSLKVVVERTGDETALSQIISLVKEAQSSKPKTQKLADRAAHYLTLIAITVGTLTFITWSFILPQNLVFALSLTITVLVIACPHALGLAIPTVTSISTTLAAQNGMLVKDMIAMEIAKDLDYVVFDKTGTLTKGEFGVTDVISYSSLSEDEVLARVAGLELHSEHVIGKGIVNSAKDKGLNIPKTAEFDAIPGKGAKGEVEGSMIYVGNRAMVEDLGLSVEKGQSDFNELSSQGKTVIYITTDKEVIGLIALADIIRDESYETISALQAMGVKTAMLTGDNELTAAYVAKKLGLTTYFADVLPQDKAAKIKELQSKGHKVAMVGDGVNDAPALVQADLGVAIGAGTDVAVESAHVVLVKNDPRDIVALFRLSRATSAKMVQNLWWATGYNAIAIPIAAGLLYPIGVVIRPEVAALIMALSSIIVVSNAFLLKITKLK